MSKSLECVKLPESRPIYLDYNATTPIAREVADAMTPFLYEHFGNPSSIHPYGALAKRAVEKARLQVASLLGCQPMEVVFTSGGTESDNFAIKGAALAYRSKGNHIITSAIEHPAVIEVCNWLREQGFRVTMLPVDDYGLVNPEDLKRMITAETTLVTVMHANNEVGTIQPIRELAQIVHEHGALIHTDAAQSVGKIPVHVDELQVDMLTVAGHKLYAPKGVGVLYVRSGVQLQQLMHGAGHEGGRRPGTENVLQIVGLGKACEVAGRDLEKNMRHFTEMRDRLHKRLQEALGENAIRLNGHPEKRLPNTLSIGFRDIEANTLLSEIGEQVAASAGAACHADRVDVSAVLQAMRVPMEYAMGTVRFSVGRETTPEDIDRAAEIVSLAVKRLQPKTDRGGVETISEIGEYKLTHYTHGLGCACKLRPQALEEVLAGLPLSKDPAVLVGIETGDDAAVYRLTDSIALVKTVDFFTPIVDDPYWFGAISATNSLSDIYAMGATPLFALSIVGFPSARLPLSVLQRILRGAQDKAAEAGISIVGGHTVDDTEPKYGLAVTGIVHPDRLVRNSTARPGDALVLTKPLGLGIMTTALKRGLLTEDEAGRITQLMATLNRSAAEAMVEVGANACTDITGFGLLGHLKGMVKGSGVDATIVADRVPMIEQALALAGADVIPGGTLNNMEYVKESVTFDPSIPRVIRLLLADAQTSGGLLISVPPERLNRLLESLQTRGVPTASVIGSVTGKGSGHITVVPS
ncbi:MAG: selenide, water dikinase SelD [Candidatus Thorarchaeota archaeon]|nr:selenide, water dikinase SelD [Candidatus Thorarchaeota archaeon]